MTNVTSVTNKDYQLRSFIKLKVNDYISLLKPRVMSLSIFTSIVGMIIAPGSLDLLTSFLVILAITIGSGASGALNMWYERDTDALMARTKDRVLPRKRISPLGALVYGTVLAIFSVCLLYYVSNLLAASLLALTIFYYIFVYTIWLKKRTPQNIVIGGAAGAFPPLIGWASVSGSLSLEILLLFILIFLWTPPHFWALALYQSDDYKKAGIPMMPNIVGEKFTKIQILIYSILVFTCSVTPFFLGFSGHFFIISACFLGIVFLLLSISLIMLPKQRLEMFLFGYSIFYLFGLFLSFVIDRLITGGVSL